MVQVFFLTLFAMVMKTALITLISTLLIAILALRSQESGHARTANAPAWNGGGGAMSVTGASSSFSGNGQRGNWGGGWNGGRNGAMSITGASGSFSSGGGRSHWGDDHDHHDGGWEGGDDD